VKGLSWERHFFDAAMARQLFDKSRWAEAPKEVRGLLGLTGLRRGGVLDASCGVGRHSLSFAKRGLDVTGVDFNASYLAQARKRAKREGLKVRFEQAQLDDLRAYRSRFDLVTNLFTSFGYYPSAAQNLNALRQMAACLRPGGQLAMELLPRERLDEIFQPQSWERVPGGYLLQERRWLAGGRRIATRAHWVCKGRTQVRDSLLFVYTRDELAALFRRAGLSRIKAYGDYDGRPFGTLDRLLMIGSRA
jgi:SAM-dependent methyltransferase